MTQEQVRKPSSPLDSRTDDRTIAGTAPWADDIDALPTFLRVLEHEFPSFLAAYSARPASAWWSVPVGPAFAGLLEAATAARTGTKMNAGRYRDRPVPRRACVFALGLVNALAQAPWWSIEDDPRGELAPLLWRYTLEDLTLVLEDIRGGAANGFMSHLRGDIPHLKLRRA